MLHTAEEICTSSCRSTASRMPKLQTCSRAGGWEYDSIQNMINNQPLTNSTFILLGFSFSFFTFIQPNTTFRQGKGSEYPAPHLSEQRKRNTGGSQHVSQIQAINPEASHCGADEPESPAPNTSIPISTSWFRRIACLMVSEAPRGTLLPSSSRVGHLTGKAEYFPFQNSN